MTKRDFFNRLQKYGIDAYHICRCPISRQFLVSIRIDGECHLMRVHAIGIAYYTPAVAKTIKDIYHNEIRLLGALLMGKYRRIYCTYTTAECRVHIPDGRIMMIYRNTKDARLSFKAITARDKLHRRLVQYGAEPHTD